MATRSGQYTSSRIVPAGIGRNSSRRTALIAPVTPTIEWTRLSCRRSHFSNRQYSPTPAMTPGASSRTSSPLTAPTRGSAKFSRSRLQGLGGPRLPGVGEDEDLVPRLRRPHRQRRGLAPVLRHLDDPDRHPRRLPGPRRSAVRSVDPSETTTTSPATPSLARPEANSSTRPPIVASSSRAARTTDAEGNPDPGPYAGGCRNLAKTPIAAG